MNALAMIGYLVGAVFVGIILTVVVSIFRSVKRQDDFRAWRWIIIFSLLAALAPYGYAEVLTRINGESMKDAVDSVLKSGKVTGQLSYYKVMQTNGDTARVLIVAHEKTTLYDNECCIIQANLVRDPKKGWKAKDFEFIDSFKRNKDGITFPPYW